ncbi:MAG: serine/threonine-protein kinase, partial [Planctomycetota bacterium]
MAHESDLLYAVLALQMNFITKDQLVECGALWASDPGKSLLTIMDQKGVLTPEARTALDAMVKAQVKQSGDPGKSFIALKIEEAVRQSLLALPLGEDIRSTVLELKAKPAGDSVETVAIPQDREERYRPGAEIGKGGLGRVVAGRDTVLDREVAIKEMLPGSDPLLAKRFMREGEIAGRLSHPNVIPVHDIGVREEEGGKTPYFVMTRIVGRDLGEIICAVENNEGTARHDFSRPRLLRIFQDVCLAMAYAHHHGVVHRDLKPANVMVGHFGEVYVVDWGLAKVMGQKEDPLAPGIPAVRMDDGEAGGEGKTVSPTPAYTMEGEVLGTPSYMSPEQADGRVEAIDERSD